MLPYGAVGSMASKRSQRANNVFDIILLEEANSGDARGSSLQARRGILERYAAEREHGNLRLDRLRAIHRALSRGIPGAPFFPKTGAKTAKSTPSDFGTHHVVG